MGSLLLSLVANQGTIINRDGVLYVDTARIFLEQGLSAAMASFSWPLLPVLMALVSKIGGIHPETAGQLLNALFMAGSCALLLSCAARIFPEAVWPTCLVILALPSFNDYRGELLREYGAWFFIMLSFWLALRWSEVPRWHGALLIQSALVLAMLFRPEALVFFVALVGWQYFSSPQRDRLRRMVMLCTFPLLGLALLLLALLTDTLPDRFLREMERFRFVGFYAKANALAGSLIEYARGQAGTILLLGSLALVPLKFIGKMGILLVPLGYAFSGEKIRSLIARSALFGWAFLLHYLVLSVFVVDLQFLAGRYVALLLAFSAPVTGYGLAKLLARYPRRKSLIVAPFVLLMVANVISLGPGKQHYVDAGNWLAANVASQSRMYISDRRVAYYAGPDFASKVRNPFEPEKTSQDLTGNSYEVIVLSVSRKNREIDRWLENHHLKMVQRFANNAGDAIIVAVPVEP